MAVQNESLQCRRAKDQTFQRVKREGVEPTKHRRPTAHLRAATDPLRQLRPMHPAAGVVLDVITVVEEQQVVGSAIMARRPLRVFVVDSRDSGQAA